MYRGNALYITLQYSIDNTEIYENKHVKFRAISVYCVIVPIIQTYRPWTPRRTSGRIVNKKI